MKKKEEGFIFIMTLIISAIISLLVLTLMQHILVYYKAMNKQKAVHQSFYQLEEVALELVADSGEQRCVLPFDDANRAMKKLIHHQGCFFTKGDFQYLYVLEELGEFPCLVTYKNNQKYATYHRRITVAALDEGVPVSLVQLRWISRGAFLQCLTQEHIVHLGLSSWRYFASIDTI